MRTSLLFLALGAAVACGTDKGSSTRQGGSAAGNVNSTVKPYDSASSKTLAGTPGAVPAGGANSVNTPNAGVPAGGGGVGPNPATALDSASIAKATGTLVGGRSKSDQAQFNSAIRAGLRAEPKWPRYTPPAGALLPAKRIVAYYGNPHSKKMGVLGEYAPQDMLHRLDETVALWRKADPSTPVQPALHLVATVAQGAAGPDGMWRRREDPKVIEQVYQWAKSRNGVFFVDIQVGHSTVEQEIQPLLPFLQRPDVHLALDPEFSMHYDREGLRPGAKIGTMMAKDVNYAIGVLTQLVQKYNLPPKILVVHRFTKRMVPDAENIKPNGHVQVVMDMDGWGPPWLKFDSYRDYIVTHPVEYTGFKIFYHNDVKKGDALLTPGEVLQLRPKPLYIQYQ